MKNAWCFIRETLQFTELITRGVVSYYFSVPHSNGSFVLYLDCGSPHPLQNSSQP